MRKQGERTDQSNGRKEAVDYEDVSEKADGMLDRFLGGTDGATTDRSTAGVDGTSAKRRNEEEDRSDEAQALVRSVLDGLQEPTMVVDTDGSVTHANSQALELYDRSEAEAVGASPHELQAPESPASDIVSEAMQRESDIQQREETMPVADRETPLERTVTLLYDDDGTFAGAMLVEKDVTERNRQREKKRYLERYQGEA